MTYTTVIVIIVTIQEIIARSDFDEGLTRLPQEKCLNQVVIDLFSLYILFSHFRPCDLLMGILLLFFHKLCIHVHERKTTFQRNYSLE